MHSRRRKMGKKWKKLWLLRKLAAASAVSEQDTVPAKAAPARKAEPVAEAPVVEAPVKKVSKPVAEKPAKKKVQKVASNKKD
jgi:hypothetical protein